MTDLPTDQAERALALQEMLVSRARGGPAIERDYRELRHEFMNQADTTSLLPPFVRICRTLDTFWGWIKAQASTYEGRSVLIRQNFAPMLDYLEGRTRAPPDHSISEALVSFDEQGVHTAWEKALGRRIDDPDGAITAAKTLLETVCKTILEAKGPGEYAPHDDLPKLYFKTAEYLNLAPSQHTEDAFKAILGGCQTVVNNLGTLRYRIGDAHGQGRNAIRPSQRHAALAVNLAGAMATFLVQTHIERAAKR